MRYVEEKWRQIKDADDGYKISNYGRVCSNKHGIFRILKPYKVNKGYWAVDFRFNGRYRKVSLHRLVALHFIPNPKNLPEVNHKDGDKFNNNRSNLNWTDGVGNMKHAREVLGFNQNGENSVNAKLTENDVRTIIALYATGNYTYVQLAEKYNIAAPHACGLVKRKFWKHLKVA